MLSINNSLAIPKLLTRAETAELIGVEPQTLAVWCSTRRYGLRVTKIGSRAMYDPRDVELFIASRKVGGGPVEVPA
jgi:hypothetical protein